MEDYRRDLEEQEKFERQYRIDALCNGDEQTYYEEYEKENKDY